MLLPKFVPHGLMFPVLFLGRSSKELIVTFRLLMQVDYSVRKGFVALKQRCVILELGGVLLGQLVDDK